MNQAATTGQLHERIRRDGREVVTLAADVRKGDFVRFNGLWQVAATPARSLGGVHVTWRLCSLSDCGRWWLEYCMVTVGICDRVVKIELLEREL
jgi:hypothetical protein